MNERITKLRSDVANFWRTRTSMQKGTMIGTVAAVILAAAIVTFFVTRTTFVPLFSDVSPAEIGRIKETLDAQGIPNEIAPGGTSISVPKEQVDGLLVQLAAEGFPQSGTIDYSFFSQNAGFGMTDNEFNVLKLASTQTELAKLMKSIQGVKDAQVMITLPEEGIFVGDETQVASASIILNTDAGQQFTEEQIKAMYNLVSKSVPNLSTDNIIITNQYSEYFDLNDPANGSDGSLVMEQMAIKKQIERDLQRQVQTMLGTLMGKDKVVVSVTTDIDFKQEQSDANLVTPVDEENMEGIQISAQRISETFTGTNADGGVPLAEDPTDNGTGQNVEITGGNGDYERVEETINNEVNRIRKQIVESPYRIRDIGIQVMVEPPNPEDAASLPNGLTDDVTQILGTIVRTSIDKEVAGELTEEQLAQKIVVSVQQFNGKAGVGIATQPIIPWWAYVIIGILLAAIVLLIVFIVRRKKQEDELEDIIEETKQLNIEDINDEKETEATLRRKQLEKMAKDKPEDFAKLLRTWIAED